ncbi:MAG: IMP dehydrogenase, partial [Nitrospinota bacterium]|nr:IMP dehydrogenase [Nitrospinota bacterium]
MENKFEDIRLALTFDDVLLIPGYSQVIPAQVNVKGRLTRQIGLNIPLVSAPMDTVTEADMAIALALEGGIGFIHKNLSIDRQRKEVDRVKRHVTGVIADPITLDSSATLGDALNLVQRYGFSGFPVIDGSKIAGILCNRDMRFITDMATPVRQIMTPAEKLITVREGATMAQAQEMLRIHKVEKIL